jgi:hypothetical protein
VAYSLQQQLYLLYLLRHPNRLSALHLLSLLADIMLLFLLLLVWFLAPCRC